MQIVDARGNPIKTDTLREPQTAKLGHLAMEFGSHPSRGLTPGKLARILEDAEQGDLVAQSDLFQDMEEKDAHIFAEMSKRKRALLTLDWSIEPPENATAQEKDDAAFLTEMVKTLDVVDSGNEQPESKGFEDLMFDALDAIGHGFSCQEMAWGMQGKVMLPSDITHRPQSWFQALRTNRNQIRLRDNSPDGAPLQPFGWLFHTHRAKSGYLTRSGLFRVLAWPFLFKNYSVRDLAEFLEIYGLPLRLGKYPAGSSDAEKSTLLRAVMGIGHNAAGIMPDAMKIEFENAADGHADPFQAMIDWCEKSQSKAILGGTLTSQSDGKSSTNALGNVHNEVRHDLLVADARQLAGSMTRDLLRPILFMNRGQREPARVPRLAFDTREPEDLQLYADAIPKLVAVGMPIGVEYAQDKLRIPQPKKDEAILRVVAKQAPPVNDQGGNTALRAALKSGANDEDIFDVFGDDLAAEWEVVTDPLVQPIEALAAQCASLEEFRDRLAEVAEQMDPAKLVAALSRGQFAARLWGRIGGDNRGNDPVEG